jgi:hypothetical protein
MDLNRKPESQILFPAGRVVYLYLYNAFYVNRTTYRCGEYRPVDTEQNSITKFNSINLQLSFFKGDSKRLLGFLYLPVFLLKQLGTVINILIFKLNLKTLFPLPASQEALRPSLNDTVAALCCYYKQAA